MKRKTTALIIASMVIGLTACGGSASDSSYESKATESGSYNYYDEEPAAEEYDESMSDTTEGAGSSEELPETKDSVDAKKISQDKLIYTCNLSIDTLDFKKSTADLNALIQKYDGFLESETYSDGGSYDSYSYYYVETSEKHNTYEATIRIPSDKYNDFLNSTGNLGDVRSRNSNVENVSQEYTDLKTSLDVYEAAYQRYLDLLATAKDESYALELQAQITETQEKIAQIKTRMNRIDTDVAYSFINIKIKEVSKYEEKPAPTDTFTQRISKAFSESMEIFADFLEGLLILIIHLLPFLVLIAIIVIIVIVIRRAIKKSPGYQKRQQEKWARKQGMNMSAMQSNFRHNTPAQTTNNVQPPTANNNNATIDQDQQNNEQTK